MILTITEVTDFDRFLETFSTTGVEKRKQHGCKGAWVFRDPENPNRVWSLFDWDAEDYEGFLTDPEIPAIAVRLGVHGSVTKAESVAHYEH